MTAQPTTRPDSASRPDRESMDDVFAGTQYRFVRPLSRGGMGEVFLVVHERTGRELVAKLLHRSLVADAQTLERVRLEAHALARLHHDNVVQVVDRLQARDGRPVLVMEHLIGRTLKDELVARGSLTLLEAVDFAHQALAGLSAAHALGIVHRDIKPENLFLSQGADGLITLKVLDFGLARVIPGGTEGPRPLAVPTETGAVLGTPRYLSPEAALGKRVDQRSDLYSLALVLYEMIVGHGPFEHLKHDFLTAHSVEDPQPPSHFAKLVPAEVDAAVLQGLAKRTDERYASAEAFQAKLEELWVLLHRSHLLETTLFLAEDSAVSRTTGQLRRQAAAVISDRSRPIRAAPSSPAAVAVPPAALATPEPHTISRGGYRTALLVASVLVALTTAIAVAGGIIALFARTPP
ncbi:MAG TPA: serine/threonine-protein kinase [Polyangiaceae bacterium]|nr:serine/threonine-protein kinase [Polyangiaceae bacterium]